MLGQRKAEGGPKPDRDWWRDPISLTWRLVGRVVLALLVVAAGIVGVVLVTDSGPSPFEDRGLSTGPPNGTPPDNDLHELRDVSGDADPATLDLVRVVVNRRDNGSFFISWGRTSADPPPMGSVFAVLIGTSIHAVKFTDPPVTYSFDLTTSQNRYWDAPPIVDGLIVLGSFGATLPTSVGTWSASTELGAATVDNAA